MTDLPDPPGLLLRDVRDADHAFLAELYQSTRTDLLMAGADPAVMAAVIGMQQQLQEHGHRSAYPQARHALVEQGGQPIGRLVLDTDAQRGMRVVDIALLPQARGLGYGRALIAALQRQAAVLGLPLRLHVAHHNTGARRLYQSLGFALDAAGSMGDELFWHPEKKARQ